MNTMNKNILMESKNEKKYPSQEQKEQKQNTKPKMILDNKRTHRLMFITISAIISIGLLISFTVVSTIQDALAYRCSRVPDSDGGPCWYCVSDSGRHHTWLGPGCGNGS